MALLEDTLARALLEDTVARALLEDTVARALLEDTLARAILLLLEREQLPLSWERDFKAILMLFSWLVFRRRSRSPLEGRRVGSVLLVAPLTLPPSPPELLECPKVRRLSNNFRGGVPPPKKVAGKSISAWDPL